MSLRSLVKYCFRHSKIRFISSRDPAISSIYRTARLLNKVYERVFCGVVSETVKTGLCQIAALFSWDIFVVLLYVCYLKTFFEKNCYRLVQQRVTERCNLKSLVLSPSLPHRYPVSFLRCRLRKPTNRNVGQFHHPR